MYSSLRANIGYLQEAQKRLGFNMSFLPKRSTSHLPGQQWKACLLATLIAVTACDNDVKAPLDAARASASTSVDRSVASSAPAFDGTCVGDTDCGLGSFGADCCAHCRFFEGSKVWINRMDSFCRGPGVNRKCPVNDCPIQMADPKCIEGHCRLVLR